MRSPRLLRRGRFRFLKAAGHPLEVWLARGEGDGEGVYPGFSFDPFDPSLLRTVYTVCKRPAVWLLCVECIDRPSSDKLQYQGADICLGAWDMPHTACSHSLRNDCSNDMQRTTPETRMGLLLSSLQSALHRVCATLLLARLNDTLACIIGVIGLSTQLGAHPPVPPRGRRSLLTTAMAGRTKTASWRIHAYIDVASREDLAWGATLSSATKQE